MPVINAHQGVCAVTLRVVDSSSAPLENALISIDIKRPSHSSSQRTCSRITERSGEVGSAQFIGLPKGKLLRFEVSLHSIKKIVEVDTGAECKASLDVRLE